MSLSLPGKYGSHASASESSQLSVVKGAVHTPMLHFRSFHELTVSPVQCAVYAPDPRNVDLDTRMCSDSHFIMST